MADSQCKKKIIQNKCSTINTKGAIMAEELRKKVTEIIVKKLGVEESQVTETANFTKDLGADSLDTVELIMELENEFDISIEESAAGSIPTVADVIKFIEAKKA